MKKLYLLLCFIFIFSLCGCVNNDIKANNSIDNDIMITDSAGSINNITEGTITSNTVILEPIDSVNVDSPISDAHFPEGVLLDAPLPDDVSDIIIEIPFSEEIPPLDIPLD